MTAVEGGAHGAGLATFSGDRVLEVFYPAPELGTGGLEPGFSELSAEAAERHGLPVNQRNDDRRDVRQSPVLTVIGDLQQPPRGAPDATLRPAHLQGPALLRALGAGVQPRGGGNVPAREPDHPGLRARGDQALTCTDQVRSHSSSEMAPDAKTPRLGQRGAFASRRTSHA